MGRGNLYILYNGIVEKIKGIGGKNKKIAFQNKKLKIKYPQKKLPQITTMNVIEGQANQQKNFQSDFSIA